MERLTSDFQNPPVADRIRPFWFWNGTITKDGIRKQVAEMAQKGLGGFFLCARQGQTVPYLSKKWFELVDFACTVAKEYGLEAWLYDEYPYPSGMAGGEVLKRHPEAEQKVLLHDRMELEGGTELQKELGWETVLFAAAYRIRPDGSRDLSHPLDLMDCIGNLQTTEVYQKTGLTMYNDKRFFSYGPSEVLDVTLPEGRWSVELYAEKPLGDFKFYGGFFDPCNADAVATFLHLTHERYKAQLGPSFPGAVRGIFSDEVGLLSPIPWSPKIPEAFERLKGYSILKNLPALHDDAWPDAYRVRYDLYDVAHRVFVASYHRQVSEWCAKNGIAYCTEVPSMRLSTQRYSSIPGGDTGHEKAGRSLEWIYDRSLRSLRSNPVAVASLARQTGKKRCLIESFHSVGWTMTLQDARWMIDRLCGSGIDFFVFHAFYYTMDSIRKHDAPPSQFFQNPYWRHYKLLADYVGRLCTFVSHTKDASSIAVLDPVPTLWALLGDPFHGFPYRGESDKEREQCDRIRDDWVYTAKTILLHQLAYNHLDSEMLPDFDVRDGALVSGDAAYRLVVVPSPLCFEAHVFPILERFVQSGGALLFLGQLPCRSLAAEETDEEVRERWEKLLADYPARVTLLPTTGALKDAGIEEQMVEKIRSIVNDPVEVSFASERERTSSMTALREGPDGALYLSLINQGRQKTTCILQNRSKTGYSMTELSMEDGGQTAAGFLQDRFSLSIPPLASRYLCLRAAAAEAATGEKAEHRAAPILLSTKRPFRVRIAGGNVFRISAFEISRDGVSWQACEAGTIAEQCAAAPILKPEDYVFHSEFGTPKRVSVAYPIQLCYRSAVLIADPVPKAELLLDRTAVAGEFCISVNGYALQKEDFYHRFINDPSNLLADVTAYLAVGRNEIRVAGKATKDSDGVRDPLYLVGAFGVDENHELTAMPQDARFDVNAISGFPYYSGDMTFSQKVTFDQKGLPDRFDLAFDFGDTCYDCLELKLNGISLGVRPFTPYRWSCRKEWVANGENDLELIRTNTLANMLDGTCFDYENHQLVHI